MTKRTLLLAAAAAIALPQAAFAQQAIAPTVDPAAATAPTTAPAAVAPTATAAYPATTAAYPSETAAYPAASYPPPMPGAVAGSVAADRDGDGVIDGYYTSDGIYHPNMTPSLPPPRLASRRGERG